MENITEKKWFVYVKDHHEGPHSLFEIQEKLDQGLVESEGFVWAEGMDDWQRMTDVALFRPLLKHKPLGFSPHLKTEAATPFARKNEPGEEGENSIEYSNHSDEALDFGEPEPVLEKKRFALSNRRVRWALSMVGLLLAGGVYRSGYLDPIFDLPGFQSASDALANWSRPFLLKTSETLPILSRLVSPIPKLDDVTPEDFADLQQAVRADVKKQGARFAVALSQSHPGAPYFYVTSNVGEGAKFKLWIVGVPDTLLNQLSFTSQVDASISKRIGRTDIVRYADGRVIPRGEYRVYLTAGDIQPLGTSSLIASASGVNGAHPLELPQNAKVLLVKNYFLAGERDASYRDRLKDFHEKLRARAMGEVIETKQFMITLASQLEMTLEKFSRLGKSKPNSKDKKMWESFHREWTALQSELDQIFQKWNPEVIKNEYFYGVLYQLVQELGHAVSQVHGLQNVHFTGNQDSRERALQLKSGTESASKILETLKSKIERVEKLPPTPSGMPQRGGL
jgi:hypothetical protein